MLKKSENDSINCLTITKVQNIIDYIEGNLYEELTPNKIAEQFYMSVSSLNSLFRTVCSLTLMEYVRNRRLSLSALELLDSDIHIIDLALKYGYETPEAFAKAFSRFHGFPPSFIRRTYPKLKVFGPLRIKLEISGGWSEVLTEERLRLLTKQNSAKQEQSHFCCYDIDTKSKGGISMQKERAVLQLHLKDMEQKEDWRILLLLAGKLEDEGIKFKVDGKTMIFAHGLEFKLEKICLTFKWNEEQKILDFFGEQEKAIGSLGSFGGFKYFDTWFEGMKIRCMFYGDCPGDETDELLYYHAEPVEIDGQIIYVQTLKFYYENAKPDNLYYKLVEDWLKQRQ